MPSECPDLSDHSGNSNRKQPFFVLTTNVDGFFLRSGFDPSCVGEIHGSVRRWQCGGSPSGQRFPLFASPRCGDGLFDPPAALEDLHVDPETLMLSNSSSVLPACPNCGTGLARPNVYLFGDGDRFVDRTDVSGKHAFDEFKESALEPSAPARLVIIEIGCGLRVPALRRRTEELAKLMRQRLIVGQQQQEAVTFVRINPEFERDSLTPGVEPDIPIRDGCLAAVERIHEAWLRFRAGQGL